MSLRPAGSLVAVAALATLALAVPRPSAAGTVPHVRCADARMLKLLHDGVQRSATFRDLVNEVEKSDVIVYVDGAIALDLPVEAHLQLVGATPTVRYLRILVKIPRGADNAIALIGHELRHATEVARAPEVRDEETMAALYRRIGEEREGGWETQAARLAGDLIREELRHEVHTDDAVAPATSSQPAFKLTGRKKRFHPDGRPYGP